MNNGRPIIYAVDFDGTIVKNDFPNIGAKNQKVIEKIRKEHEKGNVIILWTTRQNESLAEALAYCNKNDIPIDHVNENVPWLDFKTSNKIFADVYIDDRAYNPFGKVDDKVSLCKSEKAIRKQNKSCG